MLSILYGYPELFQVCGAALQFYSTFSRLRTCWPWWSLLGADQEKVLGWNLLGCAALEQCPRHCQGWHRLGDSPWEQRQPEWGRDGAIPALSPALLPREPLARGRKLWKVQHSLRCSGL